MPDTKRILIIGGVAGGASAAARARRLSEDAEIIMFERGDYISFANCGLPYHIGGAIAERERLLVQTPESLHRRFRIDVRIRTEVTAIDRANQTVHVRERETGREYEEHYDALVLSPGADPVRPPIPGLDAPGVFTLRTMGDMDAIKKAMETMTVDRALVVGGGYIGLEITEAFREKGRQVTLVELAPQVMVTADPEMAAPVKQQLALHGVDLRLTTSITSVREAGGALDVVLSSGDTVRVGIVVLSVGVRPETTLARDAGLAIGERGGIVVDSAMRTDDPAIWAVGDAVEVADAVVGGRTLIPLAGPANRQGRIAADAIFGRDSAYRGTQGTAVCKVFDLTIAMTGLNEKTLQRTGRAYEKVYVHPANHAGYYPGASPISLKLMFDPADGRILGAQASGFEGVDKRIDVLATALRAGMTVYDLEHLELCYAPPYGSAKDPVNYAGFVAANVLRGDARLCRFEDVVRPADGALLLDVRTAAEVQAGTIPGARNIPVDSLRDRLDELPRDRDILVFCQVGLRGYIACRILTQHGFSCRNLSGGYKTYSAYVDALPEPEPANHDMRDDTGECEATCITAAAPQPAAAPSAPASPPHMVDATGLQCPGPIMRLKQEIDAIASGEAVTISVTDPGFVSDIPAWCRSTGNELVDVSADKGVYRATVIKREAATATGAVPASLAKNKTIVVFSADLDRVMAAFIIANGAAAMGSEVTLFFTFWGLNALRRPEKVAVKKTLMEGMFGAMMPRGAAKLGLSRMNMGGMGVAMMKDIMDKKNVNALPDLIGEAKAAGIHLIACAMSMDVMGIKKEELIDGVEIGGVAMYLERAEAGNVNLFI